MSRKLELIALPDVPLVHPGDDIGSIVIAALQQGNLALHDSDVLVVAQKIISKAENRYVALASVSPGKQAMQLAAAVDKDPRLVELILQESSEIVRHRPGVLIAAHRLGFIMANAGIDRSNVMPMNNADNETVLLLPENPDASCGMLKTRLDAEFGVDIAVIINDSVGRAWRNGTVGIALGAAGLPALADLRGQPDLTGRALEVSEIGFADEIAAAASLLMGQADEGQPLVLVRGLTWNKPASNAAALLRPKQQDLFR